MFFRQYPFHKLKLVFHRASMQVYAKALKSEGYDLKYVEQSSGHSDVRILLAHLAGEGITCIHYCDPVDDWLQQRLVKEAEKHGIQLVVYDSPAFMRKDAEIRAALGTKKRFFQTAYYIDERRRLGLLIEPSGEPQGGKWTFDTDNRKPWPRGKIAPRVDWPEQSPEVMEAVSYVEKYFPHNPGTITMPFRYPVDHRAASQWLNQFIQSRFKEFGPYEDAIAASEMLLHHSLLSPLLNAGLLLPGQTVRAATEAYLRGEATLASVEGFVRQIVGWREFIRGVYVVAGRKERTKNFFGFRNPMPGALYDATTGIPPIDQTIKKLQHSAYNHHIERLMLLGNFMLLCEIHPDAVYQWFMEMYIDAYDWVMVPNVYGMSQFADGGLMSTKPYISGSRYVLGMSDYPKGDWTAIWDALFWRFIHLHRDKLRANPRIGMLAGNFVRMPAGRRSELLDLAEAYLGKLFSGPPQ